MPAFILRPPSPALPSQPSESFLQALSDLRETELLALEATYGTDHCLTRSPSTISFEVLSWPLSLTLRLSHFYPLQPPIVEVSLVQRGAIPRLQMYEIESQLEEFLAEVTPEGVGGEMEATVAGRICEFVMETAADWRGEVEQHMHSYECMCKECIPTYLNGVPVPLVPTTSNLTTHADPFVHSFLQNNLGSLSTLARRLPPSLKILHSELVARPHLIAAFQRKQDELRKLALRGGVGGRKATEKRVDEWTKIEVVFHGTPRRNVEAIVKGGFVMPGKTNVKGEHVHVRCGSTWGKGIYSSPDPSYCVSYADSTPSTPTSPTPLLPGQKLLVCAVLMGRRLNITEYRWTPTQYNPLGVSPSHDSHVSPGGLEWIVFDEAQIIPIVVLHLGSSLDVDSLGVLAGEGEGERGEREEGGRKRRLTALARKNLPYGFGPAGGRFVVEEVGEIDEDDVEWGEYRSAMLNEFTGYTQA